MIMKKLINPYGYILIAILLLIVNPINGQVITGYVADSSDDELHATEFEDIFLNYNPPIVSDFHKKTSVDFLNLKGYVANRVGESQWKINASEKQGLQYSETGMEVRIIYPVKDETNTNCDNPMPIIIYGYGGGFIFPIDKEEYNSAEWLAKQGNIVVVPKYRIGMCMYDVELSKRAIWRALQDMRVVIRWARGGMITDSLTSDNEKVSTKYCTDPDLPLTYVGWSAGALIGLHNYYMTEKTGDDMPRPDNNWDSFDRPYGTTDHYEFTLPHRNSASHKERFDLKSYDLGPLDAPTHLRDTDNNSDYLDFDPSEYNSLPDISICVSGALGETYYISEDDEVPKALMMIHDKRDGVVPYDYERPFYNLRITRSPRFKYPYVYGSNKVHERLASLGEDYIPKTYRFNTVNTGKFIDDSTGESIMDVDYSNDIDYTYPNSISKYFIDGESSGVRKPVSFGGISIFLEGFITRRPSLTETWRHSPMEYGKDENVMQSIKRFIDHARGELEPDFVPVIGQMYTINGLGTPSSDTGEQKNLYLASNGESESVYVAEGIPEDESAYDLLWYFVPTGTENRWSLVRAHGGTNSVLIQGNDANGPYMGDLSLVSDDSAKLTISKPDGGSDNEYNFTLSEITGLFNTISFGFGLNSDYKVTLEELNPVNSGNGDIDLLITESCTNNIYKAEKYTFDEDTEYPDIYGGEEEEEEEEESRRLIVDKGVDVDCALNTFLVEFVDKGPNPVLSISQESAVRPGRTTIIGQEDYAVSAEYIQALIESYGAVVYSKSRWLNTVHVQINNLPEFLNAFHNNAVFGSVVKSIVRVRNPHIVPEAVQNPFKTLVTEPDEIEYSAQLRNLSAELLHLEGFEGEGVKIGVIDGGFPQVQNSEVFTHLFDKNVTNGEVVFSKNLSTNTSNTFIGHDHGSKVLSVLGGYVERATDDVDDPLLVYYKGIAPRALYGLASVIPPLGENAIFTSRIFHYDLIRGIEEMENWGADIISSSVGSGFTEDYTPLTQHYFPFYTDYLKSYSYAVAKGVLVVQATGNDAAKGTRIPSTAFGIVAVGATDADFEVSSFSGYSPFVPKPNEINLSPTVCAIGSEVIVYNSETNILEEADGSSYATPLIAGFGALLRQKFRWLAAEIKAKLIAAGNINPPNRFVGYGVPDYRRILDNEGLALPTTGARSLSPKGISSTIDNIVTEDLLVKSELLLVYPNPSSGSVSVELPNRIENGTEVHLKLLSITGRKVVSKTFLKTDEGSVTWNFNEDGSIVSGAYFLNVLTTGTNSSMKLILE